MSIILIHADSKVGIGNANPSSVAAATYVIQSPTNAAKNIANEYPKPNFRPNFHTNTAQNGPTTPMENTLAPNVVIPPCAMSKACLLYTSPSPRDGLLSR